VRLAIESSQLFRPYNVAVHDTNVLTAALHVDKATPAPYGYHRFGGLPIVLHPTMPHNHIRIIDQDGTTLRTFVLHEP
jgi:hypothetical protein